jgi:hypothetical protein
MLTPGRRERVPPGADHRLPPATTRWPCATRAAPVRAPTSSKDLTLPWGKGVRAPAQGRQRVAILAFGTCCTRRWQAAEKLDATVANMRFAKPLDEELVLELARSHDALVTVEEGCTMGGAGSAVGGMPGRGRLPCRVLHLGLPDRFIEHGDPAKLLACAGWTPPASSSPSASALAAAGAGGGQRLIPFCRPFEPAAAACKPCDGNSAAPRCHARAPPDDEPHRRPAHPRHAERARRAPPGDPARGREGRALPAAAARGRRRAVHRGAVVAGRGAAGRAEGHAHVALRGLAGRERWIVAARRATCCAAPCADAGQAARRRRPHRGRVLLLPAQARAGVGRAEPAGLPGPLDRRDARRRHVGVGRGRRAGEEPVPVLEGDLRLRRAQPAFAGDDPRRLLQPIEWHELVRFAEERPPANLADAQAADEKWVTERAYENPKFVEDLVRDVALRLNADRASAAMRWTSRTSSPSTTTRPTPASSAARPNPAPTRATLEGLEVQESCFGQWLAAGGERRSRPRELPTDSAPQF